MSPIQAAENIDEVKAAFVLNFIRFTIWPNDEGKGQITLGHFEKPDLSRFSLLNGRRAQEKKVKVLVSWDSPSDAFLDSCDVLYISEETQVKHSSILSRLKNRPVLTISDIPDFAQNGGMIGLVLENNRLTFEINQAAAAKVGITFSSQVLSLAKGVLK